jgi:hypothetical protein
VDDGRKPFELRYDDRGYAVGDELWLREWTGTGYSGRECVRTVTYVLRDAEIFGLRAGSVVLGLDNTPALSVALEAARQETATANEEARQYDTALAVLEASARKMGDEWVEEYRWKTGAYHRILGFRPKILALAAEFNQAKKAAEGSRAVELRWKDEQKLRVTAEAELAGLREERDGCHQSNCELTALGIDREVVIERLREELRGLQEQKSGGDAAASSGGETNV